ncbi:MAG: septum formation initiator family protein [Candidatus Saganbacteria bacterium]|jgi:cell division protein FtsB|nr:septum formation initiator family protein [Candidatus Saganbacteria bacterium]
MISILRPGIIIFFIVLFYLLYLILIGAGENLKLKEEKVHLLKSLSWEREINRKLKVESLQLQTDSFVEGIAREKLGLIKPGEVAYKVIIK